MANYAVRLRRTASASASLGVVVADATRPRRGEVYEWILGSEAAPADNVFLYILQRITTAGTSTVVTPQPIDPADAATEFDAGENVTVEPTYTANAFMLDIPLNQRATFRWIANDTSRLVWPATASNGFGISTPTMTAVAITSQLLVNER